MVVFIRNFEYNYVLNEPIHWHEKESSKIMRMNLNKNLKISALNTSDDFETVIRKNTIGISEEEKMHLSNYDNMRDYFVKLRSKQAFVEKNSHKILESQKFTFDNKQFLQFESEENDKNGFLLFATDKNFEILKKMRNLVS
ncbi:hypothetical protein DMUE_3691 [Dictyocoela muelleri]|nr:hypothetical protein DMUE_3691 [Dictyocoela muelleri]